MTHVSYMTFILILFVVQLLCSIVILTFQLKQKSCAMKLMQEKLKAECVVKEKILAILEVRFNKVPKGIEKAVRSMTDAIALESLVEHAKTCQSLEEFAESLK